MRHIKIVALLMSLLICILCGCEENEVVKRPTASSQPTQQPSQHVEVQAIDYSNIEVIKDGEDIKNLEELGCKSVKTEGYTEHPTEEYCYPVYLSNAESKKSVYVNSKLANELQEAALISYNTMVTNGSNSTKGSILGQISSLFSGKTKYSSSTMLDAVTESALEGGYMPTGYSPINIYPIDFNTSEYNNVNESGFINAETSPLSTFAADVDTASYSNIRGIIKKGIEFGQEDGVYLGYEIDGLHDVRIEEMLNYFKYENNKEYLNDKFKVSAEISKTPWNPDTQLLTINIKGKELPKEEYIGSNLVFLIDTSGSMDTPDKLPLLKESMYCLIEELTENDTISIITYSGDSAILLEGCNGNEKDRLKEVIEALVPYGATNGEGGMKAAYKVAEKYKKGHSNNRIIMCSDGDLNVGISSADELNDFVSKKRETGIFLSVLGFGYGNYSDVNMETLADNGNGNYYYIDCIKEGRKVLVEDLMSTLVVLAKDVKFQLDFNPNYIKGYRKIGYENRNLNNEDFVDDTKDGGEVGYGSEVVVVYELVPIDSDFEISKTSTKYQETLPNSDSTDWLTLNIRYKEPNEDESKLIEYVIDEKDYKEEGSNDWKFISDVVGFGLILNDSEYKKDLQIEDIINDLSSLNLWEDENKEEFYSLVLGYNKYIKNIKENSYEED